MHISKWILCLGACALGLQLHAAPMGSAFTYQGRLNASGGQARDGIYDFRFTLYNAATAGSVVGVADDVSAVPVTNGLFTVQIDFLTSPFTTGEARWLQLQVNTNAMVPLITLNPRQRLMPTPQAIYAGTAAIATTAAGVADGAVGTAGIANESITSAQIRDESIDADDLSPDLMNARFWGLRGNSGPAIGFLGTTDNRPLEVRVNNTRGLRLEPAVLGPNVIGGHSANMVVAGAGAAGILSGSSNQVTGNFGAVGGGAFNVAASHGFVGGGYKNVASENGIVGGGDGNLARSGYSVVGGGNGNRAEWGGFVGGGSGNVASGQGATTGGGSFNWNHGLFSFIGGGMFNHITNSGYATIGGGQRNYVASGTYLDVTIGGGSDNRSFTNDYSTIGGGHNNSILLHAHGGTIGGGSGNSLKSKAQFSVVSGGAVNTIGDNAAAATIGGGTFNTIQSNSPHGTISGGASNSIITSATADNPNGTTNGSHYSFIGGGDLNIVSNASWAAIPGGRENVAAGDYSFAAGRRAKATLKGSFVWADSTDADFASTGYNQFIIRATGGVGIGTTSPFAMLDVAGTIRVNDHNLYLRSGTDVNHGLGYRESFAGQSIDGPALFGWAGGALGTTGGGNNWALRWNNSGQVFTRGGLHAAGGSDSPALHASGSRVGGHFAPVGLAENSNPAGSSSPALRVINQGGNSVDGALSVSAHGTGYIATFGNAADWVSRLTTDGTWTALAFNTTSDRNAKENFQPVDTRAVLDQVVKLSMTEWNYKAAQGVRHIGPMAQDFHAAFGVGSDEKHIATVDADGVALAAIQGLNQKVEEQRREMASKDDRVAALETTVKQLQAALEQLVRAENGGR